MTNSKHSNSPTRVNTSAGGYNPNQSMPMGYGLGPEGPSRLRMTDLETPSKFALDNSGYVGGGLVNPS